MEYFFSAHLDPRKTFSNIAALRVPPYLSCLDAYSTRDIVYEWLPGKVAVGNVELAQFEYKGANLTSDVDVYSTGEQKNWSKRSQSKKKTNTIRELV